MCMKITATGLMEHTVTNLEVAMQNRDGVCVIVPAAILNVLTQTQREDVHSVFSGDLYGLVLKRYRLAQDITMPSRIRNVVSVVPDSNT